jgi:hypothetical protein
MTRSARSLADTYPQLEAFFCGYLHQDFPESYGDVAGAVKAFRRDASRAERRAVTREWAAFRASLGNATLKAIGESLTRGLGGAWSPRRRAELEAFDTLIGSLR